MSGLLPLRKYIRSLVASRSAIQTAIEYAVRQGVGTVVRRDPERSPGLQEGKIFLF